MVIPRPDFIVIGAMKCATTTLHEQLAAQPGVFMSRPKEPNYFSDDETHARGWEWYSSLFRAANPGNLRGESSTHYTKLPTHALTVDRMVRALPDVKLIYLMRHPIDRLISHYVHEITCGRIRVALSQAIYRHPELIDYSRYAMQLRPFLEAYGIRSMLPVFFSRLVNHSQQELERIGHFLGHGGPLVWDFGMKPQNAGRDRLRFSPIRDALVQAPVLSGLRQRIVPRQWSQSLKGLWRASVDPPRLPSDEAAYLREVFDADLAELGSWLGIAIDCENFHDRTIGQAHDWLAPPDRRKRSSQAPSRAAEPGDRCSRNRHG
jgi:hypothetical protein